MEPGIKMFRGGKPLHIKNGGGPPKDVLSQTPFIREARELLNFMQSQNALKVVT
jgi:hypothetical protein